MELLRSKTPLTTAGERHTAACVRACEGIPTELLERKFILRLIAACVHVKDERIREVLEELVVHRLRRDDATGAGNRERSGPPRFSDPDV